MFVKKIRAYCNVKKYVYYATRLENEVAEFTVRAEIAIFQSSRLRYFPSHTKKRKMKFMTVKTQKL